MLLPVLNFALYCLVPIPVYVYECVRMCVRACACARVCMCASVYFNINIWLCINIYI